MYEVMLMVEHDRGMFLGLLIGLVLAVLSIVAVSDHYENELAALDRREAAANIPRAKKDSYGEGKKAVVYNQEHDPNSVYYKAAVTK